MNFSALIFIVGGRRHQAERSCQRSCSRSGAGAKLITIYGRPRWWGLDGVRWQTDNSDAITQTLINIAFTPGIHFVLTAPFMQL